MRVTAWSYDLHELWQPAVSWQIDVLLLMLGRGQALRSQPKEDPHDHFAHDLPVDVGLWVLLSVGQSWICSIPDVSCDVELLF